MNQPEVEAARKLTIKQHRAFLVQKLLDPLSVEDREVLLALVTSIVGRLSTRFQGDQ